MTREEAIENLKGCICGYEVDKNGKPNGNVTADLTEKTIDMAIKALEAPPNDNWEGYSKRLWKSAYERGKADAEQTSALNKIRAEIVQMPTISFNANDIYKADVLAIIDKYGAESEDN